MPILPHRVPRLALLILVVALLALTLPAAASASLRPGDHGDAVRQLNVRLAALGYMPARAGGARFTPATSHAVMAFQKYAGIGVDGVVGPVTDAALEDAQRPAAPSGSGRRVVVSRASQLAFLVGPGGRVRRTISVSTGKPGYDTPAGAFRVYRRERRSWSHPYGVMLPWAAYFLRGYALHGYATVPATAASHGCVRVPLPFAREVYAFATLGSRVIVE